jgi:probable phosphoglycerate mutase
MPSSSLFPEDPQPATGWVTAHCDGGARGNPGPAGYGAVLTDESGHILAELSEFLGDRTNNFAEYSGLLGCLQYALDHHIPRLRVVSDSELMVKQIQGKFKVKSPDLLPLWQEARRRIDRLDRFEIAHALRHKNKAADKLANDAMDRGTGRTPHPHSVLSTGAGGGAERPAVGAATKTAPLRGFTRDGTIHLLGGASLPDGVFVKVMPE